MLQSVILVIHIVAGSIALLSAVVPVVTKKGGNIHKKAGRVYALAMAVVFVTALPLAIISSDIFLLIIAVFSGYLVFAGWRFAASHGAKPNRIDYAAVSVMALTGAGMWIYGALLGSSGDTMWVVLGLFGTVAIGLSLADAQFHRQWMPAASGRIQRHLTNMLAGTIATVTAVLVTNLETNPAWIAWVLPTIVITPLIVWWNVRLNKAQSAS